MKLQAFLPLVTYPDPNSAAIAANAVAVAKHLDADLRAVAINADIPSISSPLSGLLLDVPGLIRKAEMDSQDRGEELLEKVKAEAAAAGVAVETGAIVTRLVAMEERAAEGARYFDLSLLGWEKDNVTSRNAAEAVVFGSGRPVVLLPEEGKVGPLDHIAIAWDGSRAAARAVADAWPFLERSSHVSIFSVLDEKPVRNDAAERLEAGLRRRGLQPEARRINTEDCPIAQTLQDHARQHGCQLLVMGGFGHSRLRDFVLGGATEGILSDLRMPVLLSH